jgi:CelD/BcsL family acetyltransferase involved in cellulose biosynthesis
VEWNAKDLIGASGLRAWEFDHVVAAQREFERFAHTRATSPVIEISSDLEALLQERHAAGVREIRAALRKMRKLEREHGDLRFVPHETAPEALATLLRWKQQQYLQTGVVDVLARPWVRQTLELAHATHDEGFAGLLSLLYAGDTLVAAHLGLRSRRVWHYWFPAYDPRFARYSPGIALLLKMVEHASALGIGSIDLGKGDARYKSSLANTTVPLVEGRVELPSIAAAAGRLRRGVKTLGRRTTLARPVRRAIRRAARRR